MKFYKINNKTKYFANQKPMDYYYYHVQMNLVIIPIHIVLLLHVAIINVKSI